MKTAKLFRNGQSQAVRLPKEFRFRGREVTIRRHGRGVLLEPLDESFQTLIDALEGLSADMRTAERRQPRLDDPEEPAW